MTDTGVMGRNVADISRLRVKSGRANAVPASETSRLISLGLDVVASDTDSRDGKISAFLQKYRSWILNERGLSRDRALWVERHSILMHLMVSGATLGEAIAILTRFVEPVWGLSARFEVINDGKAVTLVFAESAKDGAAGLISTLWMLSSMICQFEFLIGRRLDGPSGHVCGERCIPLELERLLFGRSIAYGAARTAIRISKIDMQRAVRANSAAIPGFLDDYLRHTVNLEPPDGVSQVVADIIQRRLNPELPAVCDMPDVAELLGLSVSTLRRQLEAEGNTFKAIRATITDRVAKIWLQETDLTIQQIADGIGYSDAFAFRRAFVKINGCSPLAYRKRSMTGDAAASGPLRASRQG